MIKRIDFAKAILAKAGISFFETGTTNLHSAIAINDDPHTKNHVFHAVKTLNKEGFKITKGRYGLTFIY